MPTTTRKLFRQRLSEYVGDWWGLTTSADGAANGSTLIDSTLALLTEGTDALRGFVMITSGARDGDIRRIKASGGYTVATTTLTPSEAFGAQIPNNVTYELHRYNPEDLHNAINRAVEDLFYIGGKPGLYLPRRDETLIVDNRLANGGFEDTVSGGAHPSWTNAGAGVTVAGETTRVFHGAQSASIAPGAGAAGQMTQAPTFNLADLVDQSLVFKCWVYTTSASQARIRIDFGGGNTIVNSSYHAGDDSWRQLTITQAIPKTATQIQCILEVAAAGTTAYFDLARLIIGRIHRYAIPSTVRRGPYRVLVQADEKQPVGPFYEMGRTGFPTSGMVLRLIGMDLMSRPTTESGTVEVDGERADLIVVRAAYWLFRMEAMRSTGDTQQVFMARAAMAETELNRMLSVPGIRMMAMTAEIPYSWQIDESGASDRYLVLRD